MHHHNRRGSIALLGVLSLTVLAPAMARAEPAYSGRPLFKLGDTVGSVPLPAQSGNQIFVGPMSDTGRITFGVGSGLRDAFYMGTYTGIKPGLLMQYADGKFTPIAAAGSQSPIGDWPRDVAFLWPFGMSQSGNVSFAAARNLGRNLLGTFHWNATTRRVTPVALRGMPAGHNLTFADAGGFGSVINDRDELALVATVTGPPGASGPALFFMGWDGRLLPILLPGQVLPGGSKLQSSAFPSPSINNEGAVAFLARRAGEQENSAYLWEQGAIRAVATVGTEVGPGGVVTVGSGSGRISAVSSIHLNNANRKVLLTASVAGSNRHGAYQWVDGKITPVAVPGQTMPGGGTLRALQNLISPAYVASTLNLGMAKICQGASVASPTGEHVLLATLEDNSTAAYRMDANGKLTLVLKSGANTELGPITKVGMDSPASINGKGEIALSVQINRLPTLMLLTPTQ